MQITWRPCASSFLVAVASLVSLAAHGAGKDDYGAMADELLKGMAQAAPAITEQTSWYAVKTDGSKPCPLTLKGTTPETAFEAMPGVAFLKKELVKLPDGATRMRISLNNNGRVEQLDFANMHGACMVLTDLARNARAEQTRQAKALGRPQTWTAQLPASKLLMSYSQPCSIEEVVVRNPEARGGREIRPNGDYLDACWWESDTHMHVQTQVGTGRAVPKAAISIQRQK